MSTSELKNFRADIRNRIRKSNVSRTRRNLNTILGHIDYRLLDAEDEKKKVNFNPNPFSVQAEEDSDGSESSSDESSSNDETEARPPAHSSAHSSTRPSARPSARPSFNDPTTDRQSRHSYMNPMASGGTNTSRRRHEGYTSPRDYVRGGANRHAGVQGYQRGNTRKEIPSFGSTRHASAGRPTSDVGGRNMSRKRDGTRDRNGRSRLSDWLK
jgi:hypothetical protein